MALIHASCAIESTADSNADEPSWKSDPHVVYLHRGGRLEAPEGTMPALRAAIAQGADGVEIDLRMTLDGVPVVFHDQDTFVHADGFLPVEALTFAEFAALDLGSWFGAEFAGERGLSFQDVLRFAIPNDLHLRIDLKTPGAAARVAALLDEADAWRLVSSSVDGAFADRESVRHPWLAHDLWQQGGDDDAARLRALIEETVGPFRVNVDDARVLSRVLGRHPERRVVKASLRGDPPRPLPIEVPSALADRPSIRLRGAAIELDDTALVERLRESLPPVGVDAESDLMVAFVIGQRRVRDLLPDLRARAKTSSAPWALGRIGDERDLRSMADELDRSIGTDGATVDAARALQLALALGRRRHAAAEASLIRALAGPPMVAYGAVRALGDLGTPGATTALSAVLMSPGFAALPQWAVNEVVVQLARHGERGAEVLVRALERDEPLVRREVVLTLPRLGSTAVAAIERAFASGVLSDEARARAELALSLAR